MDDKTKTHIIVNDITELKRKISGAKEHLLHYNCAKFYVCIFNEVVERCTLLREFVGSSTDENEVF